MIPTPSIGAVRRGTIRADAVAVLSGYLVLLVLLPSRLVVGPLGAAGTPANIFAIGCLLWWVWEALRRLEPGGPVRPVRVAVGVLTLCLLMSYVNAMRRPISATEASTADIGWLSFAGWIGTALLCHDGIQDVDRLRVLLRRLVNLGGFLAGLGLVQFVTGMAIVDLVQIPGLTNNTVPLGLAERNGFNRPSGTAIHAIEFSVVITMILPLALITARVQDGRGPLRRWLPVFLIVCAVPVAISRSAIVGAAIGLLVILPVLPRTQRRLLLTGCVVAALGTFVLVPGLLGNMAALFTGISGDNSALSRTNSYGLVWEYFARHPFFGRGFDTFLPAHRILDNQYLGLLMDVGLVGLVAFLGLLVAGIGSSLAARRGSTSPAERELGQALVASISVGAVGFALFDGLSFPMTAGLLFIVIGVAGALGRIVGDRPAVPASSLGPGR